jgi:hypothetical protein
MRVLRPGGVQAGHGAEIPFHSLFCRPSDPKRQLRNPMLLAGI